MEVLDLHTPRLVLGCRISRASVDRPIAATAVKSSTRPRRPVENDPKPPVQHGLSRAAIRTQMRDIFFPIVNPNKKLGRAIHPVPPLLSLAALALLALAPFAFWPAYLSKFGGADAYTHAHAALGTLWLLLLVVQPWLIQASRRRWHRLVGRIGVLLGTAFFVTGVLIAQRGVARMSTEQFTREGRFVYLPLAMAAIFGAALLMAVLWRRNAALHSRFMAATALALLDPLFARLLYFYAPPLPAEWLYQLPAFVLTLSVLVALFTSLPVRLPGRESLLSFCVGVTAVLLGSFFIPHTAMWMSLVTWFRSLTMS